MGTVGAEDRIGMDWLGLRCSCSAAELAEACTCCDRYLTLLSLILLTTVRNHVDSLRWASCASRISSC